MEDPEGFADWAERVPDVMREDPIWRMAAYRYALYLGDLVQNEAQLLHRDIRTRSLVDQLLDAVESISSNIAEGYSRTTGPDRAKFFEYAHSSARESREWLFKVPCVLGPDVTAARILLVTRVMRLLAVTIPRERAQSLTRARRAERSRRSDGPRPGPSARRSR